MVEHNVLLINVLSRDVFDDCHIQGSINVPLDQLEQFAQQLDVNQKIVVYCFFKTLSFFILNSEEMDFF